MTSRLAQAVALVGIAGTITAGSGAVANAAAHLRRGGVAVHTTKHSVSAPGTVRPGTVRLHNTGTHAIYVLKKRHTGVASLVTDLNRSVDSGGPGRLITDFTLVDILDGHTNVYLHLTRGTYYLADAWLEKYRTTEIRTVRVTGSTLNAPLPRSSAIAIDRHNALHAPKSLARHRYLHLINRSAHLQEILIFGVGPHVSTATLKAFLAKPSLAKLGDLEPDYFAEPGVIGAHQGAYVDNRITRGRYVVLAVAVTSNNNLPSLHKNRVRLVTVR